MTAPEAGDEQNPAHYHHPVLVALYDIDNPEPAGTHLYLELTAGLPAGTRVLDLGCGTGRLAVAFARRGFVVTGIDPAAASLDFARARPDGDRVRWIEADARTLAIGERFDLITMTGNAFQALTGPDDPAALIATLQRHLAPGGRFVFETRNPPVEEWRLWTFEATHRVIRHPEMGEIEIWDEAEATDDPAIVRVATIHVFRATGRRLVSRFLLRFTPKAEIERLLAAAGLTSDPWLGDYQGGAFTPTSPEFIVRGHLDAEQAD